VERPLVISAVLVTTLLVAAASVCLSGSKNREAGQLAALQYLRSEGCEWDPKQIAREAARGGSIEVLEWLRLQQGIKIDGSTMLAAADGGQIAMCQHLRSIGCEWIDGAYIQAAMHCNFDMIR
jgi:hypothetical protein